MKPRLLFYCQHVLGMGHMVRSREIVRALGNFEVCFLNGGEPVAGLDFPPGVEVVQLPPIAADSEFRAIHATGGTPLACLQEQRRERLLAVFQAFRPDILVIEMFPFGRRKFAFELVPLLEEASAHGVKAVSSVRDILVSKRDQDRHEEQAVRLLNRYFSRVLVHADPRFQRLEETFHRAHEITCAIEYTGFVSEPLATNAVYSHNRPRLLASAGGGRVGFPLLRSAVAAAAELGPAVDTQVCTGPYLPEDEYEQLRALAQPAPWIQLERYAPDFVDRMASADLLVSMAGYNTCMNILTTGVRAFVHPFTGNGNEEQTVRARKLEQLGLLRILGEDDLQPDRLARHLTEALNTPRSSATALDLQGARRTARTLEAMLAHA